MTDYLNPDRPLFDHVEQVDEGVVFRRNGRYVAVAAPLPLDIVDRVNRAFLEAEKPPKKTTDA